jgi:preprotein translocase subunit SecY
VTAVIPAMRCNEAETSYADVMTRSWVPFALSDASLLKTLFLTACRHLCQVSAQWSWQPFDRLAVKYKLDCVQSVRNAISVQKSHYSHAVVGTVVMLAYDEASKCWGILVTAR